MKKSSRLIVVLGMHRSGTSVVTRGLQVMGVELGDKLMPPAKGNNERGFWEDLDINRLNVEMLHSLKMDWHFLTPIQPADVNMLRENGYLSRAVELLEKRTLGVDVFGFKDPRTAKLLLFWKEVFDKCRLKVSYVIAVRHPLSVGRSLVKRDSLDLEKSYLLWLEHILNSLTSTVGENCVLVDYDRLMHFPEAELKRLAKVLQLQIDLTKLENFKTEFLDDDLRHTVFQPNKFARDETLYPLTLEVYSEILKVATGRTQLGSATFKNKINRWNFEFLRQKSALILADKLTLRINSIEQALIERDRQVQMLTDQLAEQNVQVETLTNQLSVQDVQIHALTGQLHEITISRAWRVAMWLRRIRIFLFPSGSNQERMVQFFMKVWRIYRIEGARAILYKSLHIGPRKIWQFIRIKILSFSPQSSLQSIDKITAEKTIERFKYKPLISLVMPTYNTPGKYLQSAIKSVQTQYYPYWELCICDDGSTNPYTKKLLSSIHDERIKLDFLEQNMGISLATNHAIKKARGEFVAFIDHDDELTSDALFEIARLLNEKQDLDAIYSDQDKIDHKGRVKEPFFKPDWSPEYFRSVMYVGHLLVLRKKIIDQAGGLDANFDGIQDYELMLRVSEQTPKIAHIPKILYHWRMIPGSVALGLDEKGEKIEQLQVKAVNAHLERSNLDAEAMRHPTHRHRVMILPKSRKEYPKISIVILTKDAPEHISRCLASIFERTEYPNYEVIIVDNGTTDPLALNALRQYPVQIIPFKHPFNYSRANNLGVEAASGDIVVLLNNDTEVISPDWLNQMLLYLDDPKVGITGPMLLYPDRTIQHAGVVLGLRGTADHIMRGFPSESDGYAGSLSCPRNVSAVTGACLMIRRNDYMNTGGLVEYYGTHYQDVDLCLRFLSAGARIVYVPYAVLMHFENSTRGKTYDHLDRALLLDSWGDLISRGDPYYNPNFSLDSPNYAIR